MIVQPLDTRSGLDLWASYVEANPRFVDEQPPLERFGDSATMADELLALVLAGIKTATASLVAEYDAEDESLPRIGQHWMVADSAGRARVVLRTTQLRLGTLSSVDAQFAYDEGEGDRTLDYWRTTHREFFMRSCERMGLQTQADFELDGMEVVFERIAVVWPQTR